ncbi:DNA primase [Paenibacillus sp. GP183]|nr:DNA primase [Paenibacillus sp. GP183]
MGVTELKVVRLSYGRIPEEVIEAVLARHDIVEVIGKYVHLTKQGHYMKGLCPFHSEKSPSFTVTPEKQIYHCFGCGVGGNSIHFLMEKEGYSFAEAVRILADEAGIPISWEESTAEQTEQQKEKASLLQAHEFAAKLYQYILGNTEQGKKALVYLRSRGMSDKLIETFQIGYAPVMWDTLVLQLEKRGYDMQLMEKGGLISARSEGSGYVDKFRERIMFPICDSTGKVIAFGGRATGDVQPKYLNSPETMLFNKSRTLYNMHLARPNIRKAEKAVLFEGYVDVIKAWEAGVHNGIATMGTALTKEHAGILNRNSERIVLCYDGDNAGQSAAFKSIPILEEAGCKVSVAMLPDNQDPDEYVTAHGSERFVREIVEPSVPSMKYKLLYIRKNFKLHEDGDRVRYLQAAVKMIADLSSPIEREHYLKQLSSEFPDSSYEALKQDLTEHLLLSEKNRNTGDNKPFLWNNVMNNRRAAGAKHLTGFSDVYNAESELIFFMIHDKDITHYVQEKLGAQFIEDKFAALSAYLYSFYSENDTNPGLFISKIQDAKLRELATSLVMKDARPIHIEQIQEADYRIQTILSHYIRLEIEEKKAEANRLVLLKDNLSAAKILSEIRSLEDRRKVMKSSSS